MKKLYTILFSMSLCVASTSQTLTYDAFSNNLSNTLNVKIANLSSFNTALLSTIGTGVTWNAAGLTQQSGTPIVRFEYGNPSTTPNGSLFPNSNYVQYDPVLTAVLNYEYYQLSTTSWENWGEYSPDTAHEIYQNSDKRLQFPFSYGESFADTYAKTNYSNATTISSTQTGTRTVSFDGFGTLLLPQGTFTNVGLIRELRTNSLGPDSTTYSWWDVTHGKQLLFFSENNGNVDVAYNNDDPLSVNEVSASDIIQIFPNPSNGNFKVALNSGAVIQKITVHNGMGQIIFSDNNITQQTYDVNAAGLSTGIGFVTIYTTDKNYIKKISVN